MFFEKNDVKQIIQKKNIIESGYKKYISDYFST